MEEQKKSKEIKMEVKKGQSNTSQKIPYEALEKKCVELYNQAHEMYYALQSKRLGYFFKIVEIAVNTPADATYHFDPDFVQSCIEEIQVALTPTEEHKKDNKEV